jgi:hypothetical protein
MVILKSVTAGTGHPQTSQRSILLACFGQGVHSCPPLRQVVAYHCDTRLADLLTGKNAPV